MDLLEQIKSFYQNYKEISLLIMGGIVTLLLTRLVPYLMAKINQIFEWLMRKVGGRLAYRNIQGKYLSWVVLQNQDLNLTGVIGSGPKPKLEQVFISLQITKGISGTLDNEGISEISNNQWDNRKYIEQKLQEFLIKAREFAKNLLFKLSLTRKSDEVHVFRPNNFWKLRQLIENENLLRYTANSLFFFSAIVFAFLLMVTSGNSRHLPAFFALGFLITSFFTLRAGFQKGPLEFVIWVALPLLVLLEGLTANLIRHENILLNIMALLTGILLGLALSRFANSDNLRSRDNVNQSSREIGKLLLSQDYIAILGKPGCGKSTYLQYLALTFAQEKAGNRSLRKPSIVRKRFGISQWYLPILIPLRKTSKFISTTIALTGQNLCIESFRQEVLPSDLRNDFSDGFIRSMLRHGKCIFLFDGLDEVANEVEFRTVVNEIKGLVSQYPKNKYLITSRYTGWRGGIGSSFLETEANELTDQQIQVFANNWYKAIENNRNLSALMTDDKDEKEYREQRAKIKASQLIEAIENVESIRNLARNPLLLSMICFVHYNKALPKERLSLYEDCSRLLLDQWDIEKGLPQDDIPLNLQRKEILVEEIAFSLHSGRTNNGNATKEASRQEIIEIIRKILERFDLDPDQADMFFHKLINRTGLLVAIEQYKNTFSFSHLTFQEFYTARFLHRNNIDIFSTIESSRLSEMNLSSWWREVIVLFSGMKKQPSHIIHELCSTNVADPLNIRVQIASQCFIEAIQPPPLEIENELMQELLKIRSHGKLKLVESSRLSKEGHAYLLRFAVSSDFYEHSLKLLVNQLSNVDESKDLVKRLILLADSSDRDIQVSAIKAILDISNHIKDYSLIDQNNLSGFINTIGFDAFLVDILNFIVSKNERVSDELANRIKQEVFIQLFQTILEDRLTRSANIIATRVSEIIENDVFGNFHETLRVLTINTLRQIFNSKIRYRRPNGYVRISRKHIIALTKILLSVSDEKDRRLYKDQITEMLSKGNEFQQICAIFLVAEFYNNEDKLIELLLQKISSLSFQVRLAAISALPKIKLSELQLNTVMKRLQKMLYSQFRLQKRFDKFRKLLLGMGIKSVFPDESILIAGVLTYFSQGTSKLFDLRLLDNKEDFYANRYEWADLMADLNLILSDQETKDFFNFCRTILVDKQRSNIFIYYMLVFSESMSPSFTNEMYSFLCNSGDDGDLEMLEEYVKVEVAINTDQYIKIKDGLLSAYYWDANAAYKILEAHGLLKDAIYIT